MNSYKKAQEAQNRSVWSWIGVLIVVLLIPASSCAQADETSRSWNQPVKPFRIAGNLYYVGASDVTSYLIVTPQGHILLDSGLVETVPQIQQNVVQLGFRLEDVKILINSHAHYDHAGGLALLKRLTGAKLMASEADAVLLAAGGKGDPNFGDKLAFEPVKADRILHDGRQGGVGRSHDGGSHDAGSHEGKYDLDHDRERRRQAIQRRLRRQRFRSRLQTRRQF